MWSSGRMLSPFARYLRLSPRAGLFALRCIPDWKRTIVLNGIGPMTIRNRRHRAYWLRDPLTHERFAFGLLKQAVTGEDVVWDIGSNIGMYVRYETQVFGAKHVVAFEPMAENLEMLKLNIARGGIENRVTVLPLALGDQDGSTTLQIDDMQSGTAVLDKVTGGRPSQGRANLGLPARTEQIELRTMDSLLSEQSLPEPTIMKIDVEGAERLVLDGASGFLERNDPLLLIELHGIEPARAVGEFLFKREYTVYGKVKPEIDPSGYTRVDDQLLAGLKRHYDLHFIVACRDPDRVPASVELYQ